MNRRTEQEQQQYAETGAYAISIKEFEITTVNRHELFVRCLQVANRIGFNLRVSIGQAFYDPCLLKMQCMYSAPNTNAAAGGQIRTCSFYVRFRMNVHSKLYSLLDYDDAHIHPVNATLQTVINKQYMRFRSGISPICLTERKFENLIQYFAHRTEDHKHFALASSIIVGVSLGRAKKRAQRDWVCMLHSCNVDLAHLLQCSTLPGIDAGMCEQLAMANPGQHPRLGSFNLKSISVGD
jgi:hypothetical protein